MIILSEIAEKLERLLNGTDSELGQNQAQNTGFYFQVEAQGFHIDHIKQTDLGNNFIPVFVGSLGGQNNPVKGLKQSNYSIPVTFYFPVRFKEKMFELGDFLTDVFVGSYLNYAKVGSSSPKYALSNISLPTYGEIVDLDLQEFEKWVANVYQKTVGRKNEPFMSMSYNLYLTTVGDGFVFGNSAKIFLTKEEEETSHEIVFDNSSISSNAQSNSEQEMNATIPEGSSLPFGTAYGVGFTAYPKFDKSDNDWWFDLIQDWCDGNAQNINLMAKIEIKINETKTLSFERVCCLQSVNFPINPGQVLSLVFSLEKKSIEEEEE